MDTFWGSGSVEGGALAFLPDFLAGCGRIAQCSGREYRVFYTMYNHKPRWGFGKSRAEWRMQRPLFARTISDALGRYWQEGDKRTGGGQNMRKATSSSEWEEKIEVLAVLIGSVHMSVCSELSWKRKGGGCLCLFSIILVCLFVFLCFVYCKYACCMIFSWFMSILIKLCPFSCLFVLFFLQEKHDCTIGHQLIKIFQNIFFERRLWVFPPRQLARSEHLADCSSILMSKEL